MLLSIIIPAYNAALSIEATLNSIIAQKGPDTEIIVVNDGSTDNTTEILEQYSSVSVVTKTNMGVSSARNTGIQHAHGRYVMFLDADDCVMPGALAKITNTKTDASIIIGNFVSNRNGKYKKYSDNWKSGYLDHNQATQHLFNGSLYIRPGNYIYNLEHAKHVRYNEELDYYEDLDFVLRLITGKIIYSIDIIVMSYNVGPNGLSSKKFKKSKNFLTQPPQRYRQFTKLQRQYILYLQKRLVIQSLKAGELKFLIHILSIFTITKIDSWLVRK